MVPSYGEHGGCAGAVTLGMTVSAPFLTTACIFTDKGRTLDPLSLPMERQGFFHLGFAQVSPFRIPIHCFLVEAILSETPYLEILSGWLLSLFPVVMQANQAWLCLLKPTVP